MANRWSDYRNTVYDYLKYYNRFLAQIASLGIEIEGIQGELQTIGDIKAVRYGEKTAAGFDELSPMERIFVRKQQLEAKLPILVANRQRLNNLIQRLDNALKTLGTMELKIVRLKFIEGRKWLAVSQETMYSERRCQDIAGRAVDDITGIMFPESVEGQQSFDFVFLDSRQSSDSQNTKNTASFP